MENPNLTGLPCTGGLGGVPSSGYFVVSVGPEFYTHQVDGLRFSDWVAAMAAYITSIINKLNP
jgi:hypothetical protein